MRKSMCPVLMGLMLLASCTGPGAFHPIHLDPLRRPKIQIVTAAGANLEGPVDTRDRFTAHESICVYSTFAWMGGGTAAPIEIDAKCYREGVLVYTGRSRIQLDMSPWHVWFDLPSGLLVAGKYRVDVCANGVVLDSHAFEVTAP